MKDHFLDQIYASPDADAPRRVYADALLERGDPRGELISLQCQDPIDANQREQVSQLMAKHGREWLGELAPVIASHRFERGFLAACHVDNTDLERLRQVVGNAAWSTVRELSGSALIGLHPVMRGLRALHFNEENARSHEGLPAAWRDLLVETPRNLERLEYRLDIKESWDQGGDITATPYSGGEWTVDVPHEQVELLGRCPALPKLRALVIEALTGDWIRTLSAAPVVQRLDELGFVFRREFFPADFGPLLKAAPVPLLSFTINPGPDSLTARLNRRAGGYATATLAISPTASPARHDVQAALARNLLAALPPSVTEVRIATPEHFEPREKLRAAVNALTRLSVREVG